MAAPELTQNQTPSPRRPAIGQKIRRRTWNLVQETIESAADSARRAPGEIGARGLAALRKLAIADPATMLRLIHKARRVAPGSAFLAQGEAMMTARARGWDEAAPLYTDPRVGKTPGAAESLLRHLPSPAIRPALPAATRAADLTDEEVRGIVIYTTVLGGGSTPAPLFHGIPGLRFLCLTDRPDLVIAGWETIPVTPPTTDPGRAAAWARIMAHQALAEVAPEAKASLFVAADRKLVGNLHTLALRWLLPHDFVLWRAESGIDWQDLAEHHLINAGPGDLVIAQARDCAARGIPLDKGACDTGMIWRRHTDPAVGALMEAWWETDSRKPGLDAISLYATLNDPARAEGPGPRILPDALGIASNNAFVAASPARSPLRPRNATKPAAGRRLPVTFVYAEKYALAASTILRGKQLGELVAAHHGDALEMSYTSDIAALRDQVVILTKGAIEVHSAQGIDDLRRRNLAVIGSWDDMLPDAAKMAALDATMAVSNRQAHDFNRLFPGTPSYHVTHHVNSQIRPMTPPTDRLRTAYFGFPANTYRPESLGHMVDFVGLDTSKVEMSWLDLLPNYNCHWIVRRSKPHDGWKPFLKGFVAAKCQAVLAVGPNDEDALQYLGDDYPFYMRSPDPKLLEYDMINLAAAFGGPEWRRAQEIMAQVAARSTDAQVCAEFRAMVEDVIS